MSPQTQSTTPSRFPCGETFIIPGPSGALEALAACPAGAARAVTAVVCHPHPLHGGTMHNKVVHTLARAFTDLGLRTLRFNFRGVGASEGGFAHGSGETDDLLAVLAWVRAQRPDDAIWLAGFSFGAYVALRAAAATPVAQLVTVAPAVHLYDFDAFATPGSPWLLIQGAADEVVPPAQVLAWARAIQPAPDVVELPEVGHFFHQRLNDLRSVVVERLRARLPLD
jgi:alpha/beta superfamily hydrolase